MGRTATLRLQRFILLSEMPLEHSYGYSCESDQKLGYGTTPSVPRRGTTSYAFGGSFCIAVRRIKSETFHSSPRFVACKGEIQLHIMYNIYEKYLD